MRWNDRLRREHLDDDGDVYMLMDSMVDTFYYYYTEEWTKEDLAIIDSVFYWCDSCGRGFYLEDVQNIRDSGDTLCETCDQCVEEEE
jgi:hypothetical protein